MATFSLPLLRSLSVLLFLQLFTSLAHGQFQFFEQMFQQGGGGSGGHQHQHQHQHQHHHQHPHPAHQPAQNVPSDSAWYREVYESAHCSNYLCPGTLSCVHFPHHCPCAWPAVEEKIELGEGSKICVSRGGWKEGEAQRKVELARQGLL